MTVLSDRDILAAIEREDLELEPFDERHLTPNGYDLGIAQVAVPDAGTTVAEGVARVPPRARFVVSTRERVRLGPGLAGQLWLRTTWARRGVLASFGRVDAGFDGQLTLAALNASDSELEVPVGQTFAQLVVEPLTTFASATYEARSGHYQHQRGVTLAPVAKGLERGGKGRARWDRKGAHVPEGRRSAVAAPCSEAGCSSCCESTEMPLSGDDVARLAARGHGPAAFTAGTGEGGLVLSNVDGHCYFLDPDGRCRVYEDRPEGCTLYPLVLDEESGAAVIDELCPHGASVEHSRRDADRLRGLLMRIERERVSRLRRARG